MSPWTLASGLVLASVLAACGGGGDEADDQPVPALRLSSVLETSTSASTTSGPAGPEQVDSWLETSREQLQFAGALGTAGRGAAIERSAQVQATVATRSVVVSARADVAGWVGARMTVRANGVELGTVTVSNTGSWRSFNFGLRSDTPIESVDVVFSNDGSVWSLFGVQQRNLYVQAVSVEGGGWLAPNGPQVTYDRGSGSAAFDGRDVIAGQGALYWNGALRYKLARAPGSGSNPVVQENARVDGVGTGWMIGDEARDEILGYASATSVNRGQSIDLFVHVASPAQDPGYSVEVWRMGWYGGAGGRRVIAPVSLPSRAQPACTTDATTYMVECNWSRSYTLQLPTSPTDPTVGLSGVYLAKLTTTRGKASYVIFVVRDDARQADFLFQTSVTTYQAYNEWGGASTYSEPQARKVSFNRPYGGGFSGSGQFFLWEAQALRFLEREGYDLSYNTNIDTHRNPGRLKDFRAFLSVGHDEYWTLATRNGVEAALAAGVNLAFIGANAAYWGIRLEPDGFGRPDRRIVAYKYKAQEEDPLYNTPQSTDLWRDVSLNRPESALIGVQYDYNSVDGDLVISDCPAWLCAGTGLKRGSVLPGLLGYEVDILTPSSPAGITEVARSPYETSDGDRRFSSMSYYTHASGASVFATGSMQWTWGLDDFTAFPERVSPAAQQMTRNVLERFLAQPNRR